MLDLCFRKRKIYFCVLSIIYSALGSSEISWKQWENVFLFAFKNTWVCLKYTVRDSTNMINHLMRLEQRPQHILTARTAHEGCWKNSLWKKNPTTALQGRMWEILRNWDFSLNWRRIDLPVLTKKKDVSAAQSVSSWPTTFIVTLMPSVSTIY